MTLRRKTGGRTAGTPNKATAEVKALAQQYGAEALEILAGIMRAAENESARVAAARELLDRAYGKSVQTNKISDERSFNIATALDQAIAAHRASLRPGNMLSE